MICSDIMTYSIYCYIVQDKAAKTWNVSSIIVEFTFNKTDFPNYSGKEPSRKQRCFSDNFDDLKQTVKMSTTLSLFPPPPDNNVSIASLDRLFDAGNVSLNQSFGCEVNRSLPNFENITADLHLSLFMMNLTVQAFEFSNTTTGEFDTGKPVACNNCPVRGLLHAIYTILGQRQTLACSDPYNRLCL